MSDAVIRGDGASSVMRGDCDLGVIVFGSRLPPCSPSARRARAEPAR